MKKEQFESITQWQNETFKKATALSKMAHLSEEMEELVSDLNKKGIRSNHVMGIFTLDEPGAWKYRSEEDEEFDEYQVNHDWVNVEGKILDISAQLVFFS